MTGFFAENSKIEVINYIYLKELLLGKREVRKLIFPGTKVPLREEFVYLGRTLISFLVGTC